ncbi:BCAM0308 family protein [Burkholderia sp. F1]|uniref:BCAM0308 family protein n=1 Tax=Burkholderia sp. F1 TaxID=3366817 RepID=UPI003D74FBF2
MNHSNSTPGQSAVRHDQRPPAHTDDSYHAPKRLKTATRCTTCGASYDDGRWTWHDAPVDAKAQQCPACKRTEDHAPAGELILSGAYLDRRRADILALLNHQADDETRQHPLERIMEIDDGDASLTVRTTGVHLLRRLGKAMLRAHHGKLTLHYPDGEGMLRAEWIRADA